MKIIKIPPYKELPTPAVEETFMSIPKKTLFCFSLRTGCLITGYLILVYTVIEILINVGVIVMGTYFYSYEFAKMSPAFIVPFVLSMVVPLVVFSMPWVGINITGIIGIHKDRPVHINLLTKFLSARLMYTVVINVFSFFLSTYVTQYFVLSSLGTVLSIYYLLMYHWYTAELDSNGKSKNELSSEKASKPYYLPDYINYSADKMKCMV